jgi:hypothetical protein
MADGRVDRKRQSWREEAFRMNREHEKNTQQGGQKQSGQQHQQGNQPQRPGQDQQGGGTRNPGQQQQEQPGRQSEMDDEKRDK